MVYTGPRRHLEAEGHDLDGNGGRLLLILVSRDIQTAAELATTGHLGPVETLRQLEALTEQGFIVAEHPDKGLAVYRLQPKGARLTDLDPQQRVLLIDDDAAIGDVIVTVLEEDGYAAIAVVAQADAVALLDRISFDLVLTDAFSRLPAGAFVNSADVLRAAGTTPVALFTAHQLKLDDVRAAGCRDLLEKPIELDALERQVRALLQP